jgi:hypothetical protein
MKCIVAHELAIWSWAQTVVQLNPSLDALLEPAYFNPEVGSTTVLSNIGIPLQNYMTAQPTRPKFIFYYRIINLHFLNKILATQDL